MKPDGNGDPSQDEIPFPADHSEESPDHGGNSSQKGERNRQTKNEHERVEESFPAISFRVASDKTDHQGDGCQNTRARGGDRCPLRRLQ